MKYRFIPQRCSLPNKLARTGIFAALATGIFLLITSSSFGFVMGWFFTAMSVAGVWVLNPRYYEIDSSSLQIRSGPFRWRISFADVDKITWLRASDDHPFTVDRIIISFKNKKKEPFTLIPPEENNYFEKALKEAGLCVKILT